MDCWNRYLQALIAARNNGVEIVELASVLEQAVAALTAAGFRAD